MKQVLLKRLLALLFLLAPADGSPELGPISDTAALDRVRAVEQARIEIIRQTSPAVACLFHHGNRAGGGSGVIIDADGYGLTNYHVIAGMLKERKGSAGLSDGQLYDIDILGFDPGGDVAMFRMLGRDSFPHVELGDSDSLRVGDNTLAMGNPFLLAEDYTPTVTLGIVSGLHRYQRGAGKDSLALRYTDCVQVAASINPGNSGGPLFDMAGKLVGINGRVSIEERGRVNVGVGYAITINQIKRFMPMLRAGMVTQHATAGFTVIDRGGVTVVDQILDDSPAYRMGLRLGDRVLRFAGLPIQSANHFASLLGTFPAGWPVGLTFQSEGRPTAVQFRLEDLPLPDGGKGRGKKQNAHNPYASNSMTRRANRRAVKRAWELYHQAISGMEAVSGLSQIRMTIHRTWANRRSDDPELIDVTETRENASNLEGELTPLAIERAARWALLEAAGDPAEAGCRVVGADEVEGRIAVVIECRFKGMPRIRMVMDDRSGELLRIEFTLPSSKQRVRFEYDDYRPADGLRLPRLRRWYLDDALHAEDRFRPRSEGAGHPIFP